MPSLSTLVLYVIAATLVLVAPGPAVLYVVSQGIRHGSRAAVTAVLGVHAGTLVQVAAAVLGLSWLLLNSSLAFMVVKYVGAAYLIYLGVKALLSRTKAMEDPAAEAKTSRRLLGEGFLVNLLNPKLALFFLAFLPQFVDPSRGAPALQITVFGLIFVLLGLCTDGAYALLAGVIGPWLRGRSRVLRGERYVVGTTFIGLGLFAALTPSTQRHN
ncbi:Threonine/homoserine/homoserine lactone efflux protein [Thermomonospora echinospora]|uniref:Threonine/homoserine/homoserine lactone efflux protein n=1 Tax=Thermomonospora echinospora TaxID=1992 RepID=A0A1H6CUW0_9ACTN|nr:LysE family translocator [Thermomonospora echinospora]SEG76752.1 Threonine/homoserine/homoserine lactone efflux protein [Thermomonospora echinospora]